MPRPEIRENFEKNRRFVIAQIVDHLSHECPADDMLKSIYESKNGWYLYNIIRRGKPTRYIYAKGFYYGYTGKELLFVIDDYNWKHIENFKLVSIARGTYIRVEMEKIVSVKIQKICFVEYERRK